MVPQRPFARTAGPHQGLGRGPGPQEPSGRADGAHAAALHPCARRQAAAAAETVEILTSTERPGITPIFGTAQPPKGLSGMMRRLAFRWSENDMRHWLILLAADRVNVVEGIGEDLAKGKVPNVLAEMGIKSEWQHNKAGLVKKAAIATAVVGTAVYLMRRRER
jgi:hypothetical protein